MSDPHSAETTAKPSFGQAMGQFVERVGQKIPDPVIIFMAFYPLAFVLTVIFGGYEFSTTGAGNRPPSVPICVKASPVDSASR